MRTVDKFVVGAAALGLIGLGAYNPIKNEIKIIDERAFIRGEATATMREIKRQQSTDKVSDKPEIVVTLVESIRQDEQTKVESAIDAANRRVDALESKQPIYKSTILGNSIRNTNTALESEIIRIENDSNTRVNRRLK